MPYVTVASMMCKQLHYAQVWHAASPGKEELVEVDVDIRHSLHDVARPSVRPSVSDYMILLLRTHSGVIHHLWH